MKRLRFTGAGPGTPASFDPASDTLIQSNSGVGVAALYLENGGSVSHLRARGATGTASEAIALFADAPSGPALTYSVANVIAFGGDDGVSGSAGLAVSDFSAAGRTITAQVSGGYFDTQFAGSPVAVNGANVSPELSGVSLQPSPGCCLTYGLQASSGAEVSLVDSEVGTAQPERFALQAQGAGTVLRVLRSRIKALQWGVDVSGFGSGTARAELVDSLVEITDANAIASAVHVEAFGPGTPAAVVTARGSTLVARGADFPAAVWASVSGGSGTATADLKNTIARATDTQAPAGTEVDLLADGSGSVITAASSSYTDVGGTGTVTPPGTGSNVAGDPLFTAELAGVFTLAPASSLIDRGDAALVTPAEVDVVGSPRALDGNFDCKAVPDIGAFEFTGGQGSCEGPATPPPAGPATDTLAPSLRAGISNRVFRVGGSWNATAARRRVPTGTRFSYLLSERADVTMVIERSTAGRRAGRACRRPAPRLRRARRCRRCVAKGALRVSDAPAGPGSKRFSGRVGRRALPPGRYRARVSATDAAGNRSRERRLAFRIVTGQR